MRGYGDAVIALAAVGLLVAGIMTCGPSEEFKAERRASLRQSIAECDLEIARYEAAEKRIAVLLGDEAVVPDKVLEAMRGLETERRKWQWTRSGCVRELRAL